jgi:hypothetical protein
MPASEQAQLHEALVRLRVAFHRRLARRLSLGVDEARLPDLVRARDDRGVLAELEAESRIGSEVTFFQWLRRLLSGNTR